MIPIAIQHDSGGKWWPWNEGHVDMDIVRMKLKSSPKKPIMINGVVVFSIKLSDGRIWDVQNGWHR